MIDSDESALRSCEDYTDGEGKVSRKLERGRRRRRGVGSLCISQGKSYEGRGLRKMRPSFTRPGTIGMACRVRI